MNCIHVDAYVNTCVADVFKQNAAKIESLSNYIIKKFQHVLRDHYVFHLKSVKALRTKKYKAHRGPNDQVGDYVLPEPFHIDHHDKAMKKVEDLAKRLNPDFGKQPMKKEEIKMPSMEIKE